MITEEVTEENIKKLIEKIPLDATPLEKVILANTGTVQTLLSVIFSTPVKVEVIAQKEFSTYIIRWVQLVAEYSPEVKITVCLAESVIDKTTSYQGFISGIREKRMNIGQLMSSLKLRTERELLGFHADNSSFSRTYNITTIPGEDINVRPLNITITEVFQKSTFKRLER